MKSAPKYPGIRITTNGNQLVSYHTEARITDGGVFYPITPSTEMGENYQLSFAEGNLNVFGAQKLAVETEGEHSAQGGAIAFSGFGVVFGRNSGHVDRRLRALGLSALEVSGVTAHRLVVERAIAARAPRWR